MRQVLRRIAVNGGLAALMLGLVGLLFAELAGMWLTAEGTGPRPGTDAPPAASSDGTVASLLKYRIPLAMALWGFVFVAACELTIYFWPGKRSAHARPPAATGPDPAEVLLEELMRQADAAMADRQPGVGSRESGVGKQESEPRKKESEDVSQESSVTTPGPATTLTSDSRPLTPDSRPAPDPRFPTPDTRFPTSDVHP